MGASAFPIGSIGQTGVLKIEDTRCNWLHQMVDTPTYGSPHKWGQHHDNIICLTGEPKGRLRQPLDERKGAGAMVTYGDLFTFVIMLCAVITLVINIKHKK